MSGRLLWNETTNKWEWDNLDYGGEPFGNKHLISSQIGSLNAWFMLAHLFDKKTGKKIVMPMIPYSMSSALQQSPPSAVQNEYYALIWDTASTNAKMIYVI